MCSPGVALLRECTQGGCRHCRQAGTAGWRVLQAGGHCRQAGIAGRQALQAGRSCRLAATAGWRLLQAGQALQAGRSCRLVPQRTCGDVKVDGVLRKESRVHARLLQGCGVVGGEWGVGGMCACGGGALVEGSISSLMPPPLRLKLQAPNCLANQLPWNQTHRHAPPHLQALDEPAGKGVGDGGALLHHVAQLA